MCGFDLLSVYRASHSPLEKQGSELSPEKLRFAPVRRLLGDESPSIVRCCGMEEKFVSSTMLLSGSEAYPYSFLATPPG